MSTKEPQEASTTNTTGHPGYQLTHAYFGMNSIQWGIVLTLLGGILWGFAGTIAQWLFGSKHISPEWLVNIRLITAGSLMLIYNFISNRSQCFNIFHKKKDLVSVCIYGIVGIALCQFSYFKTISLSNAGTACVLQYFSPIIIIIWVMLIYKRIPKRAELIAMVSAFAGVFLVSSGGNIRELSLGADTLFWGFMSAIAVAVYTIQPIQILQRYPAQLLLAWGMVIGGIVISPFTQWWTITPKLDITLILGATFIILVGTIGSFTLFMEGVKRIGPTKAGLYACIEPVVATACSALILHSSFSSMDLLGFLLVLLVPFILDVRFPKKHPASQTSASSL